MAKQTTDECKRHAHPEPTGSEHSQMYDSLYATMKALDATFGLASRTPAYHHLTEELDEIAATLARIGRTV